MPILNSIVSWFTIKRRNQIDLFKKYPIEIQNETLISLLEQAQNTFWGKKYNYKDILKNPIEDFAKRVPVNTYEDLSQYIDRIRQGEKNVLWHSDIKWIAKSSGTTNDKSKYIPVSNEALQDCHFKGGKDIIALYSRLVPENRLLAGKALAIGGSRQINKYDNDIYYGDLSAVLMKNLPIWVNFIRVPDISIALMEEWEEKIEKMANAVIKENVTNISGVPSWTLVLLRRILEITKTDNIADVWPNLELFIHGGVSFVPYRQHYKHIIRKNNMNYMETYNASEGFFAIQDDFDSDDMLLMLDYGIYYEFIPMDKFNDENPPVLSLDQVETGVNYAMVITTNSGLWRYIIGDTVIFTKKYPFKIKITGRTKYFINAFGEEIIEDNAQKALDKACKETGAIIKEYTAAPIYMDEKHKGGHQWVIEFDKKPSDLQRFTKILDDTLKQVNSDYEAKRHKDLSLGMPQVIVAPEGIFYKWLHKKGRLGGQNKVPRLANHRRHIDEILEMINNDQR